MTRIKICGITSQQDAAAALDCGADFLGFNFYPESPRYINPEEARKIMAGIPAEKAVALLVNPERDQALRVIETTGVSMVQLHGDEPPEFCSIPGVRVIKAFRLGEAKDLEPIKDYEVWAVLAETKSEVWGGSGKVGNWELSARARRMCSRLFLAGGLEADNVAEAIEAVRPWAVDVCSGVESEPGRKDLEKMERFIRAVKKASGR